MSWRWFLLLIEEGIFILLSWGPLIAFEELLIRSRRSERVKEKEEEDEEEEPTALEMSLDQVLELQEKIDEFWSIVDALEREDVDVD